MKFTHKAIKIQCIHILSISNHNAKNNLFHSYIYSKPNKFHCAKNPRITSNTKICKKISKHSNNEHNHRKPSTKQPPQFNSSHRIITIITHRPLRHRIKDASSSQRPRTITRKRTINFSVFIKRTRGHFVCAHRHLTNT